MIKIPVIDLFAGPGGLGEGFTSCFNDEVIFDTCLSIEKDYWAHKTLQLRAFFREFNEVPEEYYDYLRGKIHTQEELFALFHVESESACQKAWKAELGKIDENIVDQKIRRLIDDNTPWVLLGGPPCQAYSTVGRSRMKANGNDVFETDERHYLYKHYLRIIAVHKPTFFILENVKGLISSKIKGELIFNEILQDLIIPGRILNQDTPKYKIYPLANYSNKLNMNLSFNFKPNDFLIQCEKHGIPQRRHRIIILGILDSFPVSFIPTLEEIACPNVYDVTKDMTSIRSKLSRQKDSLSKWKDAIITEFMRIKESDIQNDVYDLMDSAIDSIQKRFIKLGGVFVKGNPNPPVLKKWFCDSRLRGFCNHEAKAHMSSDLLRYLFVSCYGEINKVSPKLRDFPKVLLPNHQNVSRAIETRHSFFSDRFRVQTRFEPSTTITSHISKDGHFFIHYDPKQCRSLTVREAARIQTFPDNYYFEGPKTEQYKQVGNAVPPLLAHMIARIVKDLIMNRT